MGVGGGWRGPDQSLGGLPRTFGLQNRNTGNDGPQKPLDRALLKRVLTCLTPYKALWGGVLLCLGASAALGVVPPLFVRGILDEAIPRHQLPALYGYVGGIIGVNLVMGLIGVLQSYWSAQIGEGLLYDLRNQLFLRLQRMSLSYYTNTRAGEIVARVSSDVAAVQGVATGTLISIANNLLTVLATLIVIFGMNPRLAVLALIVVPGLYLPTKLVGKLRRRLSAQAQETQADLLAFVQERLHVGGMLLTQLYGQAKPDASAFERLTQRVRALNLKQTLAGRWLFMTLSVFSVAGPALIYLFGGIEALHNRLTVGSIIAIVAYLANLYRPLANLANVYVDIQAALAIFERIFSLLDQEPEIADAPNALALTQTRGAVRFDGVSFAYPNAATPALSAVSFSIEPGERVALVGPSGAGKTTITYLLPRFFDPSAGRITLDGHDLKELTLESLRARLGMVTQETFLFHASVRENLLYARPDATEAQLIAAAKSAHIHDLIASLPEGYDTVVGERAFRLSGGERQRLSIARALLKNPELLILDEATSSLDATSEALIQEALETLLQNRTALIIAHRLSTIRTCDKIVVLEQGRVVEVGPHETLLAQDGLYAELYHKQFRTVESASSVL